MVYYVSDFVDRLDLSTFYTPHDGDGRRNRPCHPAMMLKVLIYAYMVGVFSSRKIAARLETDVAFRVLAAGYRPNHQTICAFRQHHLQDCRKLFVELVMVGRAAGLTKLGKVSIDGTKVEANASKRRAMSYDRMVKESARLQGEIDELLAHSKRTDAEEDARFGKEGSDVALPLAVATQSGRQKAWDEAEQQLEALQREHKSAKAKAMESAQKQSGSHSADASSPSDLRSSAPAERPVGRSAATTEADAATANTSGTLSGKELPNVADHTSDPALEAAGVRGDGLAAAGDEDRPKDPKSALPSAVDVPEGSSIDAEIARRQKKLKIIGGGKGGVGS